MMVPTALARCWPEGPMWGMLYSRLRPPPTRLAGSEPRLKPDVTERSFELAALRLLEPEAVSAVHARYFPELYHYAAYRTGDDQLAEDLASETLARMLEALHGGRGPTTSLRGWLMGTLANLVNDHFRRAYARPTTELSDDLHANGKDPTALAEDSEQRANVRRALGQLTPEQQHVLTLRFGSELSLEETAALMERSVNAVKALQFRALASLRRALAEAAR